MPLIFEVVDIDAATAVIDAAGVKQDMPINDIAEMAGLLMFYDPDGNAQMLYRDVAGDA